MSKSVTGLVFNMQRFSVHDGKGIRTMVFLKGCPLRCKWCSNPESQSPLPEKAWNPSRCLTAASCGRCMAACAQGAIATVDGVLALDDAKCTNSLHCVEACPTGARSVYGSPASVGEVLEQVERDAVFYSRSGGGLTVSGGEATMQPEFTVALLREAKRRHLNTAMETCGHCDFEILRAACLHLNMLIYDIKHMDPEKHKSGTGVDNRLILKNFTKILRELPQLPVLVRTPVVPGFNDTEEEIRAILDFFPERANMSYELLPYHRMGMPKYAYLGRDYEVEGQLSPETLRRLRELVGIRAWGSKGIL